MKLPLKGFLILLCVVITTSTVFAQKYHNNYDVNFKSGTRTFIPNIDDFINAPNLTVLEVNSDRIYRYIQFEEMPTTAEKALIASLGIQLLQYIPNKVYVASIPANLNFQLLKTVQVRAIASIPVNDKLDAKLLLQEYPAWSVKGEHIRLTVKFFKGTKRQELLSGLTGLNARVIKIHERDNLVKIIAKMNDDAIRNIANLPFVNFVETMPEPSQKEDINGLGLQRNNMLNQSSANGLKYDGTGVSILVRDDGAVGPHIDFQGRLDLVDSESHGSQGTHGDGVAGVWTGAGNLDPFVQGGAPGADIKITGYQADFLDTTYGLHLYNNVDVTNSSYSNGCNGGYTTITQTVDNQIWTSPTLIHIFSAGNSNNNNCGYGAGDQWGNITGGHKIGKNTIATANVDSIGVLVASSSRGPASDGRIKPDMAAYGAPQMSTDENNTYRPFGGTSSAAPSGAGVYTQLVHAYKGLNNGAKPESGLIKATVMNTATDFGNVGPDFKFGWGVYNGGKAYHLLAENRYLSDTINQSSNKTHTINIPANVKEARIMVYWMEPSSALGSSIALVNDIDMTVSDGTIITQPLVLNHLPNATTLDAPAVPGIDNLNNVEQVRLTDPTAGAYTVNLSGGIIPFGAVKYYVLYDFIMDEIKLTYPNGGEGLTPNNNSIIHWETYGNTGNFNLDYSIDNGTNWSSIATNLGGGQREFNWIAPNTVTDNALVRVTRGALQDVSDTTFTIVGRPYNLSVDTVCVAGFTVTWDTIPGATSYDVMVLGNKYMDFVVNTTGNYATIPAGPFTDIWYTVRAKVNDGVGTRAVAKFQSGGLLNCIIPTDVGLGSVTPNGTVNCSVDSIISIEILNNGQSAISNFNVSYQIDNQPVVTETLTNSIAAGQTFNYAFTAFFNFTVGTAYDLKVWSDVSDPLPQNDTITTTVEFSQIYALPIVENFENAFPNTDWSIDNPDADITWVKETNVTGASGGSTSAAYINNYSYNATGQEDYLYLPAMDLPNNSSVQLTFDVAYARYNASYSDGLRVEASTDCGQTYTVLYDKSGTTLATIGDQTSTWTPSAAGQWRNETIDLTLMAGQTVTIRFVAVNGYGNSLYIDNVNLQDPFNMMPVASYTSAPPCATSTTFTSTATSVTSWSWNFGTGATPATANTEGPHTVFYAQGGSKTVALTVGNNAGNNTTTQAVDIFEAPIAAFSFSANNEVITFNNTSTNGSTYLWNFGNGTNSTSASPIHTYTSSGIYTATLTVTNPCTTAVISQDVNIIVTNTTDLTKNWKIDLFPNPNRGQFTLALDGIYGDIDCSIFNMAGQTLRSWNYDKVYLGWKTAIDVSEFASGMYILKIQSKDGVKNIKLMIK